MYLNIWGLMGLIPANQKMRPGLSQDLSSLFVDDLESLEKFQLAGSWKILFKKGKKEDPVNYKPVSLASVPDRIMEELILGIIVKHLKDNTLTGHR